MDREEEFFIPRHLDEPPKFFIWPMDEVLIFLGFLTWGVMSEAKIVALILAFGVLSGVRKIKRSEGGRYFRNALYWFLPHGIGGGKSLPPSHVRKWHG